MLLISTQLVLGYKEHGLGGCGRGCYRRWPLDSVSGFGVGAPAETDTVPAGSQERVWEECWAEVVP